MPIQRIKKGKLFYYRWGKTGRLYRTRSQALKQAQAIYASGYKKGKA